MLASVSARTNNDSVGSTCLAALNKLLGFRAIRLCLFELLAGIEFILDQKNRWRATGCIQNKANINLAPIISASPAVRHVARSQFDWSFRFCTNFVNEPAYEICAAF